MLVNLNKVSFIWRIHADTRMIGTLRAVGADKRVLVNCYNGQLMMSILAGFAAALVMYLSFVGYMEIKNYYWLDMPSDMPATLLAMVGFCIVCYGCCRLALGRPQLQDRSRKRLHPQR